MIPIYGAIVAEYDEDGVGVPRDDSSPVISAGALVRSSSTSTVSGEVAEPFRVPVSFPVPVVPAALFDPLMTSRSASIEVSFEDESYVAWPF